MAVISNTRQNCKYLVFIIYNSVHGILTYFFFLPASCNFAFWIYTCMFSTALPHSCPLKRHQKIPLQSQLCIPHFNPVYLEYVIWYYSGDIILVIYNLIRTHHSGLTAAENVLLFCSVISRSSAELRTCTFRKAFHFQVSNLLYTHFLLPSSSFNNQTKCLKGIPEEETLVT